MTEDKNEWVRMVEEFNGAFGIHAPVDAETQEGIGSLSLQYNLIEEEYEEFQDSYGRTDELDAICDLIYVLVGFALKSGYDLTGAMREVHASNMTKLGKNGKPKYDYEGKVAKGENYKAPDLAPYV